MISIEHYRGADLCEILYDANLKNTPRELINEELQHIKFLKEYLGPDGLNANFYIKESSYISVDYLTDYSFYYSKNFKDYGNKCVRLHFFSFESNEKAAFDDAFWEAVLNHDNTAASNTAFWAKYYLGFMVIRPIPKFMIGYTILKHYNYNQEAKSFDAARNYWGIKTYEVHVFGAKVRIESLAFLSQDSNVAACATIAIWTMLQRAVENYYINLKSPYEITKDAGLTVHDGNRIFPNNGLNPVGICNAITNSNLVTEIRILKNSTEKNHRIKAIVNAYSRVRLPIILGFKLKFNGDYGKHATAINGHRMEPYIPTPPKKNLLGFNKKKEHAFILRSSNITELYMHDDQWGPFSRLKFADNDKLSTSWNEQTKDDEPGEVITVIISVFQKIRIPMEDIEAFSLGINTFMTDELGDAFKGKINWDIQLYFSSDFKNEIRAAINVHQGKPVFRKLLQELLIEPLPKYIWVATMFTDDTPVMHFIHDATGLRHTITLLFAFSYFPPLTKKMIDRVSELHQISHQDIEVKKRIEVLFKDSIPGFIEKISWFNADEHRVLGNG